MCAGGTQGAKIDAAIRKLHPKIWYVPCVVACYNCDCCGKPRTIHSAADDWDQHIDLLERYLSFYPPVCGAELVQHEGMLAQMFFCTSGIPTHSFCERHAVRCAQASRR